MESGGWEEGLSFSFEDKEIVIEEQLTEWDDERMAQRHVLILARAEKDGESIPVMAKIRFDLHPELFYIEDVEENKDTSYRHASSEVDLINLLGSAGYGPEYIDHKMWTQGEEDLFPGGFVYAALMTRVPGEDVALIRDELSKTQLLRIRKQLAEILEEMRLSEMVMEQKDPTFLRYSKENDKLYLVDVTRFAFDTFKNKITEHNSFVYAWGLWDDIEENEVEDGAGDGDGDDVGKRPDQKIEYTFRRMARNG